MFGEAQRVADWLSIAIRLGRTVGDRGASWRLLNEEALAEWPKKQREIPRSEDQDGEWQWHGEAEAMLSWLVAHHLLRAKELVPLIDDPSKNRLRLQLFPENHYRGTRLGIAFDRWPAALRVGVLQAVLITEFGGRKWGLVKKPLAAAAAMGGAVHYLLNLRAEQAAAIAAVSAALTFAGQLWSLATHADR